MQSRGLSITALLILAAAATACAAPASDGERDPVADEAQPITSGATADAYPEAVLIDVQQGGVTQPGCTGALIGPRTVLTSGRCASQFDHWTVRAPFAEGQVAEGVSSAVYDFDHTADAPSADEHDVGVVFLDQSIELTTYPSLADAPLPVGDQVVAVGRELDGDASGTVTYASQPFTVTDATAAGFHYDYATTGAVEHGDSGGPDFVAGTYTIVAVNAGSADGTALLARVDLVLPWLRQQLATAGSGGTGCGNPGEPGWPDWPGEPGHGWPGGPGDGHGGGGDGHGGHGGGPGDGHGGGGPGHGGGGPGDGHGGGGPGHGGGGPGDGHGGGQGDGHGGGQGDGHGGGQGDGHGGGQGNGHGGGQGWPGGGHH